MPTPLTLAQAAAATAGTGFCVLHRALAASIPVGSVPQGVQVADTVTRACGAAADGHLSLDLRPDRVEVGLQTRAIANLTDADTELAAAVSAAVVGSGHTIAPVTTGVRRPAQSLEIAVDALDIAAVLPFWRAVLGYADEVGADPVDAVIDPVGQGPSFWFQQMDAPRPQRNRIHIDITVSDAEADGRVQAALDAGGTLLSAAEARAFWVLADPEGNEACVCTWEDRSG